jgi:ribosomal protein L16 Arg81 hydroxylase
MAASVNSSTMSKTPLDFAWLLAPMERDEFFETHWEKRPLHLRRPQAGVYDPLLVLADLERLIGSREARYPSIQLSKNGAYYPPEAYCDDLQFGAASFEGVPDRQKIAAEYRAGATIVLPALHRTCPPLGDLCACIDREIDHVAHANAYLTPGNTAGFTPHYDTHEVFVLQIAGRKHWRVYEPPLELPHRKQGFTPVGYTLPPNPLLEVDLAPGDLLYLPRGHVHTTTTSDTHSAHVTIGIAVYTWLDLAGEMLQFGLASPRLRKALPPGFASRGGMLPALTDELALVLEELRRSADGARLIEMFLSRVRSTKSPTAEIFKSDIAVLTLDTWLKAPARAEYRIARQGTNIILEFKQQRFMLPGESQATLESILKMRAFRARDLSGGLGNEAKLTLVRRLHDRGFLAEDPHREPNSAPADLS